MRQGSAGPVEVWAARAWNVLNEGRPFSVVYPVLVLLAVRLVAGPPATAGSFDDRAASQSQQPTKPIFRDDGEMRLRLWVPDPFYVGKARMRIELRNKLGAQIVTETLLVTVEDPAGTAIAIKARPRQEDETQFGFAFEPKIPGTYHVRIFPQCSFKKE